MKRCFAGDMINLFEQLTTDLNLLKNEEITLCAKKVQYLLYLPPQAVEEDDSNISIYCERSPCALNTCINAVEIFEVLYQNVYHQPYVL